MEIETTLKCPYCDAQHHCVQGLITHECEVRDLATGDPFDHHNDCLHPFSLCECSPHYVDNEELQTLDKNGFEIREFLIKKKVSP